MLGPGQALDARVRIPGSKSLTNRALILAALSEGPSVLEGALWSDDTQACLEGLQRLGVQAEADPAAGRIRVQGQGGGPAAAEASVDVRMAGTAARFLTAYAALGRGRYHLDGAPRMRERPMGPVHAALTAQGVRLEGGPNLPFTVHGAGGLAGGPLVVAGGETSQPASALLMVAPFARTDLRLRVDTHRSGLPFVEMTVALMAEFGVEARAEGPGEWTVPAGSRYRGRAYAIEPDASAAAYFWALAAATGGRVHTPGIGRSRLQGDAALLDLLAEMGCAVSDEGGAVVQGPPPGTLRAGSWDLSGMADQALTVGVLALFADGPCRVRNVAHIRQHETDRIAAVVTELRRLGARCEEHPDGFTVWPAPPGQAPVDIATYGDHRMAMSFAVAGVRRPLRIVDPEVVGKTFPDFRSVFTAAVEDGGER
jgi:3-phosphoshikimate 1-carboxyvinyltransferase